MIFFNKIRTFLDYSFSLVNPKLRQAIPALSGNKAEDFVRVAEAMYGKSGKDFGWRLDWCSFFVCWVSRQSHAFPIKVKAYPSTFAVDYLKHKNGTLYYFEDKSTDLLRSSPIQERLMLHCQKTDRHSFLPQKGDIVLFLWEEEADRYPVSHMGIVKDYKAGVLETIEGNSTDNGLVNKSVREYDTRVIAFLRTNW